MPLTNSSIKSAWLHFLGIFSLLLACLLGSFRLLLNHKWQTHPHSAFLQLHSIRQVRRTQCIECFFELRKLARFINIGSQMVRPPTILHSYGEKEAPTLSPGIHFSITHILSRFQQEPGRMPFTVIHLHCRLCLYLVLGCGTYIMQIPQVVLLHGRTRWRTFLGPF